MEAGMRGAPAELLPLLLFLVLSGLFVALGVLLVARPGRAAALFADRDARRAFRPRDARALGVVLAIGGGALIAAGAVRLAIVLTEL